MPTDERRSRQPVHARRSGPRASLVQVYFRLDRELRKQLKVEAQKRGMTMQGIFGKVVRLGLGTLVFAKEQGDGV